MSPSHRRVGDASYHDAGSGTHLQPRIADLPSFHTLSRDILAFVLTSCPYGTKIHACTAQETALCSPKVQLEHARRPQMDEENTIPGSGVNLARLLRSLKAQTRVLKGRLADISCNLASTKEELALIKHELYYSSISIAVDPAKVKVMLDPALRDQIELHRRLRFEKSIPKKSHLQCKQRRFDVVMKLIDRYEAAIEVR
ncbi:hypothetical protein BDN67DRAFT_572369 [Paxillus ammoniavirescens]|nr:hypothetical protein BDN67DRAFT_572369 [Paxillus ammoniavirescens]